MKKIFTLIAVAAMAISANAENKTVSWMVTDAPAMATPIIVKDGETEVLQIAFGTMDPTRDDASGWSTGTAKVNITYGGEEYKFTTYATSTKTNGFNNSDLAADGSSTGNYVAFSPKYSGTLIIAVQNQGGKTTWLFENGVQKAGTLIGSGDGTTAFDGGTDIKTLNNDANYSGGIKVDVKADKLYTISVQGSKGRWMGVIFEYDETTTGISTVKAAQANDAVIYNLAGQKVTESYKGVVIKNGKKVVIK
ncbi:MAG: hypothetical protein IJ614_08315 [Prevotella sp.]|nr:hypothetical protein [Prevotella sp.]